MRIAIFSALLLGFCAIQISCRFPFEPNRDLSAVKPFSSFKDICLETLQEITLNEGFGYDEGVRPDPRQKKEWQSIVLPAGQRFFITEFEFEFGYDGPYLFSRSHVTLEGRKVRIYTNEYLDRDWVGQVEDLIFRDMVVEKFALEDPPINSKTVKLCNVVPS